MDCVVCFLTKYMCLNVNDEENENIHNIEKSHKSYKYYKNLVEDKKKTDKSQVSLGTRCFYYYCIGYNL